MRRRGSLRRVSGFFAPFVVATFAVSCSGFDTSRTLPPRGTLGEELFGVMCDRVGGQSLHEDLTGASFHDICHPRSDGTFADKVDQTQLPPLTDGQPDLNGTPVPLAKQQADRGYGVARVETLARHRTGVIAALDATFPDIRVAIKDLGNPDPKQSCNAPASGGEGPLHTELTNLLGRFQNLYNDGTIPQSTEAIARVVNAFKAAPDAQSAWAVYDARAGYRPIDITLGAARPVIAYPNLRDFANATLKLLSADSSPYDPNAQYDANGNRVPVPGAAYPQLEALMSAAHAELLNATVDPTPPPLVVGTDPQTKRTVLSRPRQDLELLQSILYAQDPTFGGGTSRYIVQRDSRGYVVVPLVPPVNGKLPAPFVDMNGDGLPDVDATGQFVTSSGKPAPTPFFAANAPDALARDTSSRALDAPGGKLLYGFIDTSHTYTATLVHHLQPLVDPNPADAHETLMDFLAGGKVVFGARKPNTTKTYADGSTVTYAAFDTGNSPMLDLVYALGQVLADPTADDTLSFATTLVTKNPNDVARIVGDALYSKKLADADTTAHIPPTSTLWDDVIDVAIQIEKEPGLLEDVMRALGDDASLPLGNAFAAYGANLDRISYDRNNLNGPAFNFNTMDGSEPKTAVDRTKPDTGVNRSELQRFLQVIHDTNGVTACNKQGAVVHALGTPLGSLDLPAGPANSIVAVPLLAGNYGPNKKTFNECEVFKIENLAAFYIDSMLFDGASGSGPASLYFRDNFIRSGVVALGGLGAATVGLIEQSSGIGYDSANGDKYNGVASGASAPGFWDLAGSKNFHPKPAWLDRLVFFDLPNDSPMSGGNNYTTNHFLSDLQGTQIGSSICPERVIADPCAASGSTCAGAPDVSADKMVHGLRACPDGDWLFQRDQDATFVWEDLGFYSALSPIVTAFGLAKNPTTGQPRRREDLFLALMEVLHKHWQSAKGTGDECTLQINPPVNCSKDGADSYEPLLAKIFSSDMLTALHDLVKIVEGISIPTCAAADPKTNACTQPGPTVNGISVLASAARALLDPDRAKAAGLKDRSGKVTSLRNDGTTNPQVTPLYLVLETLNEMDQAFTQYAQQNPNDMGRQAQWKHARSQLVDEFLSVNGQNTTTQTFADPTLPKVLPLLIDAVRAQLAAHCPAGTKTCTWASTDLTNSASATIGGPTFAATMDLTDAIRQDAAGRAETEKLLSYLVNAASSNDALAELLASADDLIQVMRDDTNLVPLYHVLATATLPTTTDANGHRQEGVVDSTTALLARIAGRAYDGSNTEICAKELDPNAVLDVALAHLVTPMPGANGGQPGETPLEVILDAVADVNRASPGAAVKMKSTDYANVANEVSEFLTDGQRGLEQFYAIVREGTVH